MGPENIFQGTVGGGLGGSTGEKSLAKRIHPVYSQFSRSYRFWRDTYEGGPAYCMKYLHTHRLENAGDFTKRKERVYFLNYTANIVDIWTNAIFRAGVTRQNPKPYGGPFIDNMTGKGVKADSFWKRAATFSAVHGRCYILIDTPYLDPGRLPPIPTAVIDTSLRPYLKLITAEALVDWSMDELGNFRWALIKLQDILDNDPIQPRVVQDVFLLLEPGKWTVYNQNDEVIRTGEISLDIVPLVTVHQVDFDENQVGESLIKDIADLNKAIFNWCSLLDEIIYEQTFGQLVVAADEGEVDVQLMGTKRILTVPKDTPFPPLFISPDASQAGIIMQQVAKSVREMFRLGFARKSGLDEPEQYNTAQGKIIDLFDLQQALANKSMALQQAEKQVAKIVSLYYGQKNEEAYVPVYPTNFDLRTLEGEIEDYMGLKLLDFGPEFNFEFAKRVVAKALPYLSTQDLQKLLSLVQSRIQDQAKAPDLTIPPIGDRQTDTQTTKE